MARKSRSAKERKRLANLKKPARQRVRKTWEINPAERIENPKRGQGAHYERQQWRQEGYNEQI